MPLDRRPQPRSGEKCGPAVASSRTALYNERAGAETRFPSLPPVSQHFVVHASNPQRRLLSRASAIVRAGGVIAYPTDSTCALGCGIQHKQAQDRIRALRGVADSHEFSLVCRDISELAVYGRVDNAAYRLLRACTPGPYTFILRATRDVPRRLQDPKRKTVGLRVPANVVARRLVETLGEPLMSSTLMLPGDDLPLPGADAVAERLGSMIDAVLDAGHCGIEPTTVVDLTADTPVIVREGRGDPAPFVR